jgi:serpin B
MRTCVFGLVALALAGWSAATARAQKRDAEIASLVQGNNEFAAHLYGRLAGKENGNLFLSPYSISNALAMTYAGARGDTAAQMRTTLRFPFEADRLHPAFGRLIGQIDGGGPDRKFQLSIANRLWGQKGYGFLPDFTRIGQTHYRAGLEEVDFITAAEAARQRINGWVENETKNKIKDLIPPGAVNDLTRLVLTNAIYFKGNWVSPFPAKNTGPGDFHLASGKTVKVPMMRQGERTGFADLGDFSMVQLSYEGHQQSMLVLLPKKNDGLAALEKQLSAENLKKWSARLSPHIVDLTLPKFKVTAQFKLNDYLKEMGMTDAFNIHKADFGGMATREKLFISAVLHKAYVDVNEVGTEAAAATAVVIGTTSAPPPAAFRADHPFLFLIRDDRTGSILFLGRLADPS